MKPLADAGKVKLLAVTPGQRPPVLPDLPAVGETYPRVRRRGQPRAGGAQGTAGEVVALLTRGIAAILADPAQRAAPSSAS